MLDKATNGSVILPADIVNLVKLLTFRARHCASKRAVGLVGDDETLVEDVSFAALNTRAQAIGAWLAARGGPGQRVMLSFPSGVDYIAAFFGCLYAGAIAVPVFPPHSKSFKASRLDNVLGDCGAEIVLTSSDDLPSVQKWLRNIASRASAHGLSEISDDLAERWVEPALGADDIAFLQYTSGSTNVPKGVIVSHGNLLHNMRAMRERWLLNADSTIVSWLPLFHDLGMVGNNLLGVFLGSTQYLIRPQHFVKRPVVWLRAIGKYQAHIAMAPNFAYRLCSEGIAQSEKVALDLSSWRVAVNCGEPIVPEFSEAFTAAFAECGFRKECMTPTIGMAEATLCVSSSGPADVSTATAFEASELRQLSAHFVSSDSAARTGLGTRLQSCGWPMDEMTVRIVDPIRLSSCGAGQVGELWISGPSVALGYWNKAEATEHSFCAYTAEGEGPFLRSGDQAFIYSAEIFMCGRLKDMIIIGGQNFAPSDIEFTVERADSVLRRDFVVACTIEIDGAERLVIVGEIDAVESAEIVVTELMRNVTAIVAETYELQLYGLVLVSRGSLSKTTSGKVTRQKTRTELIEGQLAVVAEWLHPSVRALLRSNALESDHAGVEGVLGRDAESRQEIAAWLQQSLAELLGLAVTEIDPSLPFAAHGLGSIGSAQLAAMAERRLGVELPTTLAYDYPSVEALAAHLCQVPTGTERAEDPLPRSEGIAVVGLACRVPGANDVAAFWENLRNGVDSVRAVDSSRWTPSTIVADSVDSPPLHTQWGGFVDQVDQFDPEFFGISAAEAAVIDPQQRLLLEVSWEALESAGISADRLAGTSTGVFVGISNNDYARLDYSEGVDDSPYEGTGNAFSIAANRISYLWDLRGPSMAIDTACSSSLVAVHMACGSLIAGESSLAIVAGVNLLLAPDLSETFSRAGMMSPRGRCRSFDDGADGYVRGEGCVALLLKPVSAAVRDGDRIHAVIRGSAVNQDGRSNGLTAPNGPAQEAVIRSALRCAGVAAETIDYIEAHGSGTPLGDPIEAQALSAVFAQRSRRLLVGSVKTNIGHLEAAAGIAGLLKVILGLGHQIIPASLNFDRLNHRIAWDGSPIALATDAYHWPQREDLLRRAGVASFGFGGTNAHVIVEQAPVCSTSDAPAGTHDEHILVLSAKSQNALLALANRYASALERLPAERLADFCVSAGKGRTHFRYRIAVVGNGREQLHQRLLASIVEIGKAPRSQALGATVPKVAWLFSGQGGVHAGMAAGLYRAFPVFRRRIDECVEWCKQAGVDLGPALLGDDAAALQRGVIAQPAQLAFQLALSDLWTAAGVVPAVVCGHSIGEYAAACSAGMLTIEDALSLLLARGRLIDEYAIRGGMLAVACTAEQVGAYLLADDGVVIAARNGPSQTVCSGLTEGLESLAERLQRDGIRCVKLAVGHAFHSPLMRPVLAPYREFAETLRYRPSSRAFASCANAQLLAERSTLDSAYWTGHIEAPVQFDCALRAALALPVSHVLEIGPRPVLTALGQTIPLQAEVDWLTPLAANQSVLGTFLGALARLYCAGATINWSTLDARPPRAAFELPTYPFQRKRCWNRKPRTTPAMSESKVNDCPVDPGMNAPSTDARASVAARLAQMIGSSLSVAPDALDPLSSFLEMGMDSISLIGVVRKVEREFGLRIEIRQMFETLSSLDRLTDHVLINATLGATETRSAIDSASAAPASRSMDCQLKPASPVVASMDEAGAGALEAAARPGLEPPGSWQGLLKQQIESMASLMQSQLALISGNPSIVSAPARALSVAPLPLPPRPPAALSAPSIPMWKVAEASAPRLTPIQRQHLDQLVTRYCARTRQSKDYQQRHRQHLADNRVVGGFRALTKEMHYPLVSSAARGAQMWDLDGNEYIDVTMGFGVNLFGHNPPFVTAAIQAQLASGMQLGPQANLAGEVADLICELTGNDRAAFVSTGTEAVMIACRLARAATGRDTIVIFNGAYHGQHDSTIAVTDPDDPSFQAIPGVPGVTAQAVANTVMLGYDDPAALQYIEQNAGRLAAVLVEPVQSRQPELQPRKFLHELREITERHDIALIFDEMITGFRCHPGGAQALFEVRADLVTYGKVIGGGLPIGVISGRRRYMDIVDGGAWRFGDDSYPSVTTTFVSGTHSKHPLSMAAARAVLLHLKEQGPSLQRRLNERTAAFASELNAYFSEQGLPIHVPHFSSIFRIAFAGNANLMYYHLLEKGVFLWEGRVYALSTAHTDADLAAIIAAIKSSVEELRTGAFLPPASSAVRAATAQSAGPGCAAVPASLPGAVVLARPIVSTEAAPEQRSARAVEFSLSFFGRYDREYSDDKYDLLFAGARFADQQDFAAVWVPERHFHPFGGFSPNPSVTAAALARETSRIQIRAGSVVIPLHHPIRIAEEWALVDNLSHGRVGIAAASGWHPDDFVFAPEQYRDNREVTFSHIEAVQRLWAGDSIDAIGGTGKTFAAKIFPMPKQARLPIWITVVKNPETYIEAGRRGFGVLTNMMGQTVAELRSNIALYRQARGAAGFDPAAGIVTVLVHTYVTNDAEEAQRIAAIPFQAYLSTMTGLLDSLAKNFGKDENFSSLSAEDRTYLLEASYRRYIESTALIGSPDSCAPIVTALHEAGVDEFACFIDFGIDTERVLRGLPYLNELRMRFANRAVSGSARISSESAATPLAIVEEAL